MTKKLVEYDCLYHVEPPAHGWVLQQLVQNGTPQMPVRRGDMFDAFYSLIKQNNDN